MSVPANTEQARLVWRVSTEYPRSNISGVGLETFARLVHERTGGLLTLETAFESPIGSGNLMRAAVEGALAGGDAFAGPMEASDPLFGLASLPFVVQSVAAARDVNAKARPAYEAALARHGMRLLYITIWPATGLWSDRRLRTVEDLRALAIRTYDYNSARLLQAAGAKAEYLPFNEAVAKVERGELNAILTSGDGGAGRKLWEHLSHFTAIAYATPISLMFVRDDLFGALPEPVRRQVLQAAHETEQRQVDLLARRNEHNQRRMRENGVAISSPSDALLTHLRASARPVVSAWQKRVPADVAMLVQELNDAARGADDR